MADHNYLMGDELTEIRNVISYLNTSLGQVSVKAKVTDINGDVIGTVKRVQVDDFEYVFVPKAFHA